MSDRWVEAGCVRQVGIGRVCQTGGHRAGVSGGNLTGER